MTIPHIAAHLMEYSLNPKAFINAHNFSSLQDLVQEVVRIDNDELAYREMYLQPLFLNNFNPCEYYERKLGNFLDSIFMQKAQDAFRRGNGNVLKDRYERILLRGANPKKALKYALKRKLIKYIGKK